MESRPAWFPPLPEFSFQFQILDFNNRPVSRSAQDGFFRDNTLYLHAWKIPLASIQEYRSQGNRFVELVVAAQQGLKSLTLEIKQGQERNLRKILIAARSRSEFLQADHERKAHGISTPSRSAVCPDCLAVTDLTLFVPTPHTWCGYCDTLLKKEGDQWGVLRGFRLCQGCLLFGYPRLFSKRETSDYYLYTEETRTTRFVCPGCIAAEAKQMLATNVPKLTVLLEVFSLWMQSRAHNGPFPKLHQANSMVVQRKFLQALKIYQNILEKFPDAVGVRFNIARTYFRINEDQQAMKVLEHILTLCDNYQPAAKMLLGLYHKFGLPLQAQRLAEKWNWDFSPPEPLQDPGPLFSSESDQKTSSADTPEKNNPFGIS